MPCERRLLLQHCQDLPSFVAARGGGLRLEREQGWKGSPACRRERRRAQGLPEELTPEEQEEERRKLEEEAARQARTHLPVKPITRINRMREILVTMKKTCTDDVRCECCDLCCGPCCAVASGAGAIVPCLVCDPVLVFCDPVNSAGCCLASRHAAASGGASFLHVLRHACRRCSRRAARR